MGADDIRSRMLRAKVEEVGAERIRRHIFLCADQTEPKCSRKEASLESWEYLKRRLKELGLEARVVFTGAVSDADLHNLYALATVFAHPSLYEGSSLVTLEKAQVLRCGTDPLRR